MWGSFKSNLDITESVCIILIQMLIYMSKTIKDKIYLILIMFIYILE
jgi:hypothetical protein